MRLLLDTVTLILAVESPAGLSKRATAVLKNPANILELSAISLPEIAFRSPRGKLKLSQRTTRQAIDELGLRILPYTAISFPRLARSEALRSVESYHANAQTSALRQARSPRS